MGGLAIGGGAILGSGAFSSIEAEREVEIRIIDDDDIADEFLDILYRPADFDSAFVNEPPGDEPEEFFPESGDEGGDADYDENEVSLIANDVTLAFGDGDENGLLPNTTTNYNELLRVVKTGGDDIDLTLETEAGFLEFDEEEVFNDEVQDDDDFTIDVGVVSEDSTTDDPDQTDTLIITINEA